MSAIVHPATDTMHRRWRAPNWRRRWLEAAGWRTWLSYRENHVRDESGRMVAIEQGWIVELEHVDSRSFAVEAFTPAAAWAAAWDRARR